MVSNAAMMYGMMPNMYYNQIALNDLTNMNLAYPTGMGFDPMFSMNSSIFGGGLNGGMPFMPTFGGNVNNYYQNLEQYDDFMFNRQIRMQQKMRDADIRLNSPQEGVQKQVELLHDKILRNEQEQIKVAYQSLIESVRQMYPNASKEEIENRAEKIYKDITQTGLFDDIRKNGRGAFTQGFLQTATFGLCDGKTAEENISDLTGLPVGRADKTKKTVGNIVGGAVVGGVAGVSAGAIFKGLCKGMKNKGFWAIGIGAVAGLFASLKN